MIIGGYEVDEMQEGLSIKGIRDFNLKHTFECGQCFRWEKRSDTSYAGIVKGKHAIVSMDYEQSRLYITGSCYNDFRNIWYDYFDFSTDYSLIGERVAKDDIMKEAVRFGYGLRLLRQDPWETLISFIISANNRIPMIMKTIGNIASMYGRNIALTDSRNITAASGRNITPACDRNITTMTGYSFPGPYELAGLSECELMSCKAGFRCGYIIKAAEKASGGGFNLESLRQMSVADARKKLMEFRGVGCKVADCTLLYSGIKFDVFPIDVWIKRVMETLYFKREASLKEIQQFAADYFGDFAGYAQQYLFYYARENKIGVAKTHF